MAKRTRNTWVLVVAGAVALVVIGGLVALQPGMTFVAWLVRACALLGYVSIFAAALSSAFMRRLIRFFGRAFVKVHHTLSVTGLALIVIHPLAAAWRFGSLSVFLPRFGSWTLFLTWGGPVAWYLIGLASLAALLRTRFRDQWRPVHWLNYIAFFLITAHAIMLGSDMQPLVLRVLAVLMSLGLVAVFVIKLLERQKRRAKRS